MWKRGSCTNEIWFSLGTAIHLGKSLSGESKYYSYGSPFPFNYANSEGKNWANKYRNRMKLRTKEESHSSALRKFDQIPNHFSTIQWLLETAQDQFAMHITINRLGTRTWNSTVRDFGKASGWNGEHRETIKGWSLQVVGLKREWLLQKWWTTFK